MTIPHVLRPTRIAALVGLAFAAPVFAQDAAPPAAPEAGRLQTVTVTAERVTEDAKTVPIAVSTLGGEVLDILSSSGDDIRALSGRVPSLNIESSFGRAFPRFYIRGYGNTDFHLNASQPVSLVMDDVVQENPILKGFPVFDVDQVEVLAGPQGTLFGRNTPAGVVKIDSVRPGRTVGGYFNGSYGTFGTTNLEGAINVPLGPDWAMRVSVLGEKRDNWVRNTAPNAQTGRLEGYEDGAERVQFQYKPAGGDFSALISLHERDLQGTARLFRANIIQPGTNDLVPGFDPFQVSIDGANSQELQSNGVSAHLRWNVGGYVLNSISAYEHVSAFSRGDVDGGYGAAYAPPMGPGTIPFSDETSDALGGHGQWTQELRVEHAAGALDWQAGLYFFHETYNIASLTYDTLFGADPTEVRARQVNNAWAAFGSAAYALTPELKLRAGLRYSHDGKSLTTTPVTDTAVDDSAGLSKRTRDARTTWDVSATYALSEAVNVYARIATGFRASSIFPASDFNPTSAARPETDTSYELGAKGDLFDRRARFTADVFHYDVRNQQLSAVGGADNSTLLLNAKKAMGQGVEFSLDAYLTPNFLVTASGSVNVTKIRDGSIRIATCASCTVTDPKDANGLAIIDGNPLPQAPKYIANVTARYGIPLANGGEFFAYTDWSYRSKVNFFLYDSVEFTGKPLTVGGLRLGYDWDGGKYEVAAYARNITNQIRVTGGIDFNNLTGFINDPRTYGVQFKAQF
jgi:iron complex outermembrane receptor protein